MRRRAIVRTRTERRFLSTIGVSVAAAVDFCVHDIFNDVLGDDDETDPQPSIVGLEQGSVESWEGCSIAQDELLELADTHRMEAAKLEMQRSFMLNYAESLSRMFEGQLLKWKNVDQHKSPIVRLRPCGELDSFFTELDRAYKEIQFTQKFDIGNCVAGITPLDPSYHLQDETGPKAEIWGFQGSLGEFTVCEKYIADTRVLVIISQSIDDVMIQESDTKTVRELFLDVFLLPSQFMGPSLFHITFEHQFAAHLESARKLLRDIKNADGPSLTCSDFESWTSSCKKLLKIGKRWSRASPPQYVMPREWFSERGFQKDDRSKQIFGKITEFKEMSVLFKGVSEMHPGANEDVIKEALRSAIESKVVQNLRRKEKIKKLK